MTKAQDKEKERRYYEKLQRHVDMYSFGTAKFRASRNVDTDALVDKYRKHYPSVVKWWNEIKNKLNIK